MSKHTSGPWLISRGAQADAFAIESPAKTIAHVKHSLECTANAHLIAAAPDLLAACQDSGVGGQRSFADELDLLADGLEVTGSSVGGHNAIAWAGCLRAKAQQIRAAIAKLEGGNHTERR